jgi:spermidine/putrescine transport system substrate-binding protein
MKCNFKPTLLKSSFKVMICALAALVTGCEKGGTPLGQSPAQPKPAPAEEGGGNSRPANIVTVYTWEEYLNPDLLAEFKERTGITVEPKFYESSDEMVEGLKSDPGQYDVFLSEDGYIPILEGKRLMLPLELKKLENWKNLDQAHVDQPFDPGNRFTVPYLWGTTLLAYRKDKIPDLKHSWSIMFDEKLTDRIAFLDDRMECYAGVLRSMGVNLPEANPEQIAKAAESLLMLVKDRGMRLGGNSGNEVKQYLIEGTSWVSMIYSGDAARIAEENPTIPIGYFIPEEGATVWTDSFCVSRDTTRLENAYKFLDFMLEAKSAAASSNFLRYASPNKAAAPFIEKDLLEDETIYPRPELLAKCRYFKLRDVNSQRALNIGWQRVTEAWMARSGQVHGPSPDASEASEVTTAPN